MTYESDFQTGHRVFEAVCRSTHEEFGSQQSLRGIQHRKETQIGWRAPSTYRAKAIGKSHMCIKLDRIKSGGLQRGNT